MIQALYFIGFFGFYVVTSPGTIPAYRDSGDMINAIATLGIAHPPGYPLYVLMGKLFTVALPLGTVAYRVNLLSAFFAAATLAFLYGVLRKSLSPWESAAALLLLGFTPAFLSLARVSEMYTMAAFFAVGILACRIGNTSRDLFLGSFLLGCGFGVHPTLLFLAPLLVTFRREAFYRLGFFLLGFSVVFFLMIRSAGEPLQNWGNPSTFLELWRMITRSNYGGLKLHPVESQFAWTFSGFTEQIFYFFKTWFGQWGWVGILAGVAGLFNALNNPQQKHLTWSFLICWVLAGPFFFVLSNLPLKAPTTGAILEPYLLLGSLIWVFWVAQGFQRWTRSLSRPTSRLALLGVLLIWPLMDVHASFKSFRAHFYAYDLGRNILRTLPPRAVLYDPDDSVSFTLRGLQLLEQRRDDILLLNFFRTFWGYRQIITRFPDFLPPAPVRSAQDFEHLIWTEATKRRPFYAELPAKIPPPMSYRIEGILYPIQPAARVPTDRDLSRAEQFDLFYVWRGSWRTTDHSDFFTRQILNYRSAASSNLGMKYAERKQWDKARSNYERALQLDPFLAAAHNNLGVVEFEQGRYDRAMAHFSAAQECEPENAGYRQNFEMARKAKSPP